MASYDSLIPHLNDALDTAIWYLLQIACQSLCYGLENISFTPQYSLFLRSSLHNLCTLFDSSLVSKPHTEFQCTNILFGTVYIHQEGSRFYLLCLPLNCY